VGPRVGIRQTAGAATQVAPRRELRHVQAAVPVGVGGAERLLRRDASQLVCSHVERRAWRQRGRDTSAEVGVRQQDGEAAGEVGAHLLAGDVPVPCACGASHGEGGWRGGWWWRVRVRRPSHSLTVLIVQRKRGGDALLLRAAHQHRHTRHQLRQVDAAVAIGIKHIKQPRQRRLPRRHGEHGGSGAKERSLRQRAVGARVVQERLQHAIQAAVQPRCAAVQSQRLAQRQRCQHVV